MTKGDRETLEKVVKYVLSTVLILAGCGASVGMI